MGWDGGVASIHLLDLRRQRDRLATAPPPPPHTHRAGAVRSVNKDSKKWSLPLFSAFRQLFSWARTGGHTRVQNSISRRTATLSLTQKITSNALTPPPAGDRGGGRTDCTISPVGEKSKLRPDLSQQQEPQASTCFLFIKF